MKKDADLILSASFKHMAHWAEQINVCLPAFLTYKAFSHFNIKPPVASFNGPFSILNILSINQGNV